ncbi:MAG: S8 family serine peptidase [Deinococcaceae bacterium]
MIKPTFLAGAWLTLSVALVSCGSYKAPSVSNAPQPLQTSKSIDLRLEHTDRWFIEFDTPTFNGLLSSQAVQMAQQNFRTLAHQEGIDYQENYAYTRLFSGMSIRTNATAIGAISRMPGVKAVYPVRSYSLPKTKSVTFDPQMATAVSQTGVDIAQNKMGLRGKGIRVGIIDTGLDLQHPAFAADRIVAKYDLVGNDYDASTNPVPKPDEDPDDNCDGHGTHVAGIVGANGTIKGAAPAVSLGIYRVFGCKEVDSRTSADVLVAALEQAVADNMDIVNMSLGSFGDWTGDPLDQAVEKAAKQGLIVVFSAGNSGAEGPFATGGHASASASISVANFENIAIVGSYLQVGESEIHFNEASHSTAQLPTSGTLELTKTGNLTTPNDACAALPQDSLKDKAVLIRRGGCTFYEKAINAQNAGAAAVLIYNNTSGLTGANLQPPEGEPQVSIPTVTINKTDGEALYSKIVAGIVTMKWLAPDHVVTNPRGNLAADSSSYGPTHLLDLKPDIGAPGNYIYSTFPLELKATGYATLSGTSMSAPHVAGAIALLLEKRPDLKDRPEVVRTLLQNHAIAQNFSFKPDSPLLEAVHRQGAGMLDIVGSIEGTTSIEPGRLALGDGFGPFTKTLTFTNTTDQEIVYTPKHKAAMGTFGSLGFNPATDFREGASDVKFVQTTVKVPANGTATVDIVIKPPAFGAEDGTVYGGYLTFESGTAPTLSVPYLGLKGNYQALPALVDAGLLWFNPEDGKAYPQGPNAQFDLGKGEFPILGAQFAMPVEKGSIDILNGDTMMPVYPKGSAWIDLFHTGRNTVGSIETFIWDGSLKAAQAAAGVPVTKTLPNGRYAMRIKVMRAGGAENNPADWDTFVSPAFYIIKTVPAPTP